MWLENRKPPVQVRKTHHWFTELRREYIIFFPWLRYKISTMPIKNKYLKNPTYKELYEKKMLDKIKRTTTYHPTTYLPSSVTD